jgi:GNAT superfamily N-acetyltransferase
LIETPGYTPAYQLGAWDDGRLVGVLFGIAREDANGSVLGINLMAVDPAYQRSGIASQLLTELGARAQAQGVTRIRVGGLAPNYLWPGPDLRYTAALCFFQHHGYQKVGEAYNMRVDLSASDWDTSVDEQRLATQGWHIRRLQPDDQAVFGAWLEREWSAAWQYEGLYSYENDPISTFVAVQDSTIRAFACYDVSGFENTFGPTGAEPQVRGLGIGKLLYHRCLAELRQQGHMHAEVGWVGPVAFYARTSGAFIHRVCWFLEKSLAHP